MTEPQYHISYSDNWDGKSTIHGAYTHLHPFDWKAGCYNSLTPNRTQLIGWQKLTEEDLEVWRRLNPTPKTPEQSSAGGYNSRPSDTAWLNDMIRKLR